MMDLGCVEMPDREPELGTGVRAPFAIDCRQLAGERP
jgi:hypothetical protein